MTLENNGAPPIVIRSFKVSQDHGRNFREIDLLTVIVALRDTSEKQQVVDELTHSIDAGPNPIQAIQAFRAQIRGVVFNEDRTEAVNSPKGSAQIVRDGVAKGFHLLVGFF